MNKGISAVLLVGVLALLLQGCVFRPIKQLCVHFVFGKDPLDPDEMLELVGPLGIDGAGFRNVGSEPQTSRTLCFDYQTNPETIKAFSKLDGRVDFKVTNGTVSIQSVGIEVWR